MNYNNLEVKKKVKFADHYQFNKNEVKKTFPNKSILKLTESFEEAKSELKRITERTSGTVQDEAIKVLSNAIKSISSNNVSASGLLANSFPPIILPSAGSF